MAVYNLDNYTSADGLGFPLNFRRGNPNPLDNSSVWASLAAAENYAKTDPTAYVGQPLTVIETGDSGTVAIMYTIQNENGDLSRVGTVTLGDDITIVKNADDTMSIKGYTDAAVGAQLVKTASGLSWIVPSTDTVDGLKTTVETLSERVGDVEEKAQSNEDSITTLNADSNTAGSVDYKIAHAVAQIIENPDVTMNSINELVTWCNEHAQEALSLSNQVTQNGKDIDALETLVGSTAVATQITNAITSALKIDGVDKYALAADLTAAIARVAALELKSHEHSNKALLDTYDQSNADIKDTIAKKHSHANASIIDTLSAEKISQWDAAQENAEKTASDALASVKAELESDITAAQTAAEKVANDNNNAMNTRVTALEAINHDAYKAYADQAEADAISSSKSYSDSLAVNYDSAGSAATAETNAKAYTDAQISAAVMAWGEF